MGSPNFSEIAARVAAGSTDVRACLVVSSDGLTLGVFPEDREDAARAAWGRMVASGEPEPERGFLVVGEEIWAFTRRGGYGALAVAGRAVRPGLLLDDLDGALREMHQERVESLPEPKEVRKVAEPRRRTALHPEPRRVERRVPERPPGPPVRRLAPDAVEELEDEAPVRAPGAPARAPEPAAPRIEPRGPVNVPVDTVELTREFGGLLDGPGGR